MTEEYLILVDKNDNPIGREEKVRCHLPKGKLHRAFTALILDEDSRLLLTRRSDSKMLWPGYWDGTVASHPRESESYVSSAQRRLPEEIGIECNMDYLFKFEYHVPFKDVGSENEVCGTLVGVVDSSTRLNLVKEEISEYRWVTATQLISELQREPQKFCPWMLIALYLLPNSDKDAAEKNKKILNLWMNSPNIKEEIKKAIKIHIPDDNWRLIEEK